MAVAGKKEPKRSREANKAYRRQQLIDATIDCINKLGFADTTLAKVAERANLSQGIVIFHFKSKDLLFLEALTYLADEYSATWRKGIERAGVGASSIEKVCALVNADFEASLCTRKKIAVWYAFWGETKSHPNYQAVAGDREEERGERMVEYCLALCADGDGPKMGGEATASVIDNASDGYWQRMYLNKGFSRKDALDLTYGLLVEFFPSHKDAILKCKK